MLRLGLGLGLMGVSSGGPVTENTLIANRQSVSTDVQAIAANAVHRRIHYFTPEGNTKPGWKMVFFGWYIDATGIHDVGAAVDYNVYVEYPANTFTQVLSGGSATITCPDGSYVMTDGIPITGIAGEPFIIHTVKVTAGTTNAPCHRTPYNASALYIQDSTAASYGSTGFGQYAAATRFMGPNLLIGDVQAANAKAFVCLHDSIGQGYSGTRGTGPKDSVGFMEAGLASFHPYFMVGTGSLTAALLVGLAEVEEALGLFNYTHLFVEIGLNDLDTSTPKATVFGYLESFYADYANGAEIWQVTYTPKTTGSQDTVAGQTVTATWTPADINGSIRTETGITGYDVLIDVADYWQSGRDSGKWAAPDQTYIYDRIAEAGGSTHPSQAGIIRAMVPVIEALNLPICSEASAVIARMGTAPTGKYLTWLNATMLALKNNFMLDDLFDGFYVMSMHNQADSKINWSGAAPTMTTVNSPTWAESVGFTTNGSSSYLDVDWDLSTDVGYFVLNSAHLGIANRTKTVSGQRDGGWHSGAAPFVGIALHSTGGLMSNRINDGTAMVSSITVNGITNGGYYGIIARDGASSRKTYKIGGIQGSDSTASTGLPASTHLTVGRWNTEYRAATYDILTFGRAPTVKEAMALQHIVGALRVGLQPSPA